MNKTYLEKEIKEIPGVLRKRRRISLENISSLLEEPILITGIASSVDLPGRGAEEYADNLGINLRVRYANEVYDSAANTVIALSVSGETEETIEALRKTKAKIKIAITANEKSSIVQYATHVIPMICGEQISDVPAKTVAEQSYIVSQLLAEKFGDYEPITDKEILQIDKNLSLKFPNEILEKFAYTSRVVIVGCQGLSQEIETKFEEITRTQAEVVFGPLVLNSAIEVLTQGEMILVIDPERMKGYKSVMEKTSRAKEIFYIDELDISGKGRYGQIIKYAGLVKFIASVGKAKSVDIDHPELFVRTARGFRTPLYKGIKKVVLIGGGSGIPPLAKAFKKLGHNVCGITSMIDSGGSAGKLRKDYKVLPPGDIRRIIAALSDHLRSAEIMNYRFKGGDMDGHTLGNILIAALQKISGFQNGKEEVERMFMSKGKALPATLDDCQINAELENGEILRGEDEIDVPLRNPFLKIKKVWLEPKAKAFVASEKALLGADIIIIGPGDLYSTIAPSLLIVGIAEAVRKSKAKKIYVCNAMTKLGETVGYTASDFVDEIEKHVGKNILDFAVYNQRIPSKKRIYDYQREAPFVFDYVRFNRKANNRKKPKLVGADLVISATGPITHDPDVLAKIILSLI